MTTQNGSDGQAASGNKTDTVRQTIVETIAAPILGGIKTKDSVLFRQKRKIYELRISEKNADGNTDIQLTTYCDFIPKPFLRISVLGDWVSATTIESITEEELKDCIEGKACVNPNEYELGKIDREIRNLKMEKDDPSDTLEMQVWNPCLKYTTILENCGYSEFITTKRGLAVEHILKRVSHIDLKNRMLCTIKLNKDKGFKKNFKNFTKGLAQEARFIDRINSVKRFHASVSDSDEISSSTSKTEKGKTIARGKSQTMEIPNVACQQIPEEGIRIRRETTNGTMVDASEIAKYPTVSMRPALVDISSTTAQSQRAMRNAN